MLHRQETDDGLKLAFTSVLLVKGKHKVLDNAERTPGQPSPVVDLGADSLRTTFAIWVVLVLGQNSSSCASSVWDTDSELSAIQNTGHMMCAIN
jgi:hypothetical protein